MSSVGHSSFPIVVTATVRTGLETDEAIELLEVIEPVDVFNFAEQLNGG